MTRYTVRRDGNKSGDRVSIEQTDIFISNPTVSSVHGTLTVLGNGLFEIHDLGSKNGTFIREHGQWVQVTSAELHPSDEMRLGTFVARVGDLFGGLPRPLPQVGKKRLERNPETGEIIEKKWR